METQKELGMLGPPIEELDPLQIGKTELKRLPRLIRSALMRLVLRDMPNSLTFKGLLSHIPNTLVGRLCQYRYPEVLSRPALEALIQLGLDQSYIGMSVVLTTNPPRTKYYVSDKGKKAMERFFIGVNSFRRSFWSNCYA